MKKLLFLLGAFVGVARATSYTPWVDITVNRVTPWSSNPQPTNLENIVQTANVNSVILTGIRLNGFQDLVWGGFPVPMTESSSAFAVADIAKIEKDKVKVLIDISAGSLGASVSQLESGLVTQLFSSLQVNYHPYGYMLDFSGFTSDSYVPENPDNDPGLAKIITALNALAKNPPQEIMFNFDIDEFSNDNSLRTITRIISGVKQVLPNTKFSFSLFVSEGTSIQSIQDSLIQVNSSLQSIGYDSSSIGITPYFGSSNSAGITESGLTIADLEQISNYAIGHNHEFISVYGLTRDFPASKCPINPSVDDPSIQSGCDSNSQAFQLKPFDYSFAIERALR